MKPVITLFFLLNFTCVTYGQTVLKYTLDIGDTFTVKQNAEQIITQELEGASHILTNTLDGILEFRVKEVVSDTFRISMEFKDLNLLMTSSIQGELMNVKAKDVAEEDIQSRIFNSLLNQPVEMLLSPTGNILEVNGGDSLVSRMADSSGLEDDFSKNMMKKSLEKEFGSEALSNSYKQLTYIYSNEAVDVGESWKNTYIGKLNAENTWTLNNLDQGNAMISGSATVVMDIDDPATTMNLAGKQRTEIKANRSNGFIESMRVVSEAIGFSKTPQLGDQEVPTTIESTITYKLIDQ